MASRYSSEILVVLTAAAWDSVPVSSVLYLALFGGWYEDAVNPSGPKVNYEGRIKSDIVFEKTLGVLFWNEDSEIDFGYIDIALEDQPSDIIDFASNVTEVYVDFYRVNTTDSNEEELQLLASSRSSDIAFVDEYTLRFRLESMLRDVFDSPINQYYYDDTYEHLEGSPYPIAWGAFEKPYQLLPTIFVDDVALRYDVTDLDIVATGGANAHPYDRGIALDSEGSGNEFVIVENGFELLQNPDGKITFGVTSDNYLSVDPEDTGNFLVGLFRLTRLAMTRVDVWDFADTSQLQALSNLQDEKYPFFHTLDVTSLSEYLNTVLGGIAGYYHVDETGIVHFGRLENPDGRSPALNFTDSETIGDIEIEDDMAPCLSTRLSYGFNPGAYLDDELAGGVTPAERVQLTSTEYTVETTENVITFYRCAGLHDPISYPLCRYDSTSKLARQAALDELNRWWGNLYHKRRRFYSFVTRVNDPIFDEGVLEQWTADQTIWTADNTAHTADGSDGTVSASNTLPKLGQYCTLQSDRFALLEQARSLFIRKVRFNFSTGLLTIQAWG